MQSEFELESPSTHPATTMTIVPFPVMSKTKDLHADFLQVKENVKKNIAQIE